MWAVRWAAMLEYIVVYWVCRGFWKGTGRVWGDWGRHLAWYIVLPSIMCVAVQLQATGCCVMVLLEAEISFPDWFLSS